LTGHAIDDLRKNELKVTWIAQLAATFYFTFPLVGIYESYQLHHELYGLLQGVTGKIAIIYLYMNILINPMHGSLKFNDTITVSFFFFFFLFFLFFGPSLFLMALDDIINFEVIFNYYKKAWKNSTVLLARAQIVFSADIMVWEENSCSGWRPPVLTCYIISSEPYLMSLSKYCNLEASSITALPI
jgi:hypothetical protein